MNLWTDRLSHLAVAVQRRPHARLQVVQCDRLQHVEVVGHLILDRTGAQDDVLDTNTDGTLGDVGGRWGSPPSVSRPHVRDAGGRRSVSPYRCTDGRSSCSGRRTFPGTEGETCDCGAETPPASRGQQPLNRENKSNTSTPVPVPVPVPVYLRPQPPAVRP